MGIATADLVTRPKYPPLSRDRRSNAPVALCFLGEEFAGPEKLGLAPKVLQNLWALVVLQNLSSTDFLLGKTFCRTFMQHPKGSAQTIVATPPLLSANMAYRNPKTGFGGGGIAEKLSSEADRAIGDSHEIVSLIAP